MQFSQLAKVEHRGTAGRPRFPNFGYASHTPLLARGQGVNCLDETEALVTRGALTGIAELRSPQAHIRAVPAETLPKLWGQCMDRVGEALQTFNDEGFNVPDLLVLEEAR